MSNIEQKYNIGLPVFKKLFELSSKELKAKLSAICGTIAPDHLFGDLSSVKKVIVNDEPDSIEVYAFDCLSVNPFGIYFNPEHTSGSQIIEFNQHFTL